MQLSMPRVPQEDRCEVINVTNVIRVLGGKQPLVQALIICLITAGSSSTVNAG